MRSDVVGDNTQWRPVIWDNDEYPYEVSSDGRVRRVGHRVCLTPGERSGYLRVALCKGGHQVWAAVHRLVATAFLGPAPDSAMVVHHRNEDRRDNRVANLAWVSTSENRREGSKNAARVGGVRYSAREAPRDEVWQRVMVENEAWPYEVSNLGHVRRSGQTRVLKWGGALGSYPYVGLSRHGRVRTVKIHQLVAEAFVPGKSRDRCIVNHKNGQKDDNRAVNLEWVTLQMNAEHARSTGLRRADSGRLLSNEQIATIRQLYRDGVDQVPLGEKFGISQSLVSLIIRGERYGQVAGPVSRANAQRSGKRVTGSANHAARLTDHAVSEIRRRWDSGEATQMQLANEFGVLQTTISKVVRRVTWKHVQ